MMSNTENPPEFKASSVLLVEDSLADAVLIREKVKSWWPACPIVEARSIREAREQYTQHNFGLILLDLDLPDSSGAETVKEVRNISAHIPIVVITGFESRSLAQEVRALGANDVVLKSDLLQGGLIEALRRSMG